MEVPGKDTGPSLIISQDFTVHGHVVNGRESRDRMFFLKCHQQESEFGLRANKMIDRTLSRPEPQKISFTRCPS